MAQVEQRLNDIDRKLDRLMDSLMGDGINAGFVGETRTDIRDVENDISELSNTLRNVSNRVMSASELSELRKVLSFLTGWKLTIGLILWLAPLIVITLKLLQP